MTDLRAAIALLPCPFCGAEDPRVADGSTYRWMVIGGCCCDVEVAKRDRSKPADDPVNLPDAYAAWNTRAAAERAAAQEPVLRKFDPASEERARLALYAIGNVMGYGWAQAELGREWERVHDCAPRGEMGVTVQDQPAQAEPPAAPADPQPVAWIQPDHLQKAVRAPFLCRVEPTQRMADFVPLYTGDALTAQQDRIAALTAEREIAERIEGPDILARLREGCASEKEQFDVANSLVYLWAQNALLSQTQDECRRLREQLAEVERPLDAQMARLNQTVTEQNSALLRAERALAAARAALRAAYKALNDECLRIAQYGEQPPQFLLDAADAAIDAARAGAPDA